MQIIQQYDLLSFAQPSVGRPPGQLTTLFYLPNPVNCVVAGQQREPVKNAMGLDGAITGPLKGIFGE